ncbi:MAG TPA: prepilin-type N-terminal cleavage/methylation domain-containing protein [Thiobacillus sp.]|nr:prepilin-type N-terminal cleavage/methylation domain-containing protein [Thiobacillus sp.]
MQHATAIGISAGKWSSRTRLPARLPRIRQGRRIFVKPAPIHARNIRPSLFLINELSSNQSWNAFCMLALRQKLTERSTMHHPNVPRRQSGFTLIEIAIVLVIIGLLLGGILKGQELITQGRIRNVSNDFQSVTAAINLYQDRYRALPGDDAGAVARWEIDPPTGGTLGDGIIAGGYNAPAAGHESRQFWLHLRRAGLVGGAIDDNKNPPNAASGITGVQNGAFGIPGVVICTNNLPAKIAQAIDTQFDDGNSETGTVRATAGTNAGDQPDDNYVDDGTNFYVVCKAP